jgi:hypothetical protein
MGADVNAVSKQAKVTGARGDACGCGHAGNADGARKAS